MTEYGFYVVVFLLLYMPWLIFVLVLIQLTRLVHSYVSFVPAARWGSEAL